MPFYLGDYNGDYTKTEPIQLMQNFHERILAKREEWIQAHNDHQPASAVEKIEQEAGQLRIQFMNELVDYIARKGETRIHTQRGGDKLSEMRREMRLGRSQSVRAGHSDQRHTHVYTSDTTGETQYTVTGGSHGDAGVTMYKVYCGPLRCGTLNRDTGRCMHGNRTIVLCEPPPGWNDEAGWEQGRNWFQIE
ncbi:hypothetical protein BDW02DRAFT_581033 [Decorospora gaudefroyi]|uniref:Uncharacterized protein n=1 Tax=Decorospora gaudefroyi TaxID=184978 RepID=A0A6A5K8S7_9PLEO|nr:hypothetical protein BDW02DRAFT_581033 [Decorospora gaudefroyi]